MKILPPLLISLSTLLIPIQLLKAADKPLYQITAVKSWDTLNLRSAPGVSSKVVTKIPADGKMISQIGTQVTIGKTIWVKVAWQGKQGWVSKHYLRLMSPVSSEKSIKEKEIVVKPVQKKSTSPQVPPVVKKTKRPVFKEAGRNQWILSCGDRSPFWKVEVHPEMLKMYKGNYKVKLPITYKKQIKNKWNTAKRTHLKGAYGADKLDLDIRFAYAKCDDTLSKLKLPYSATMTHNGEKMTGCCRAIKLP